MREILKWKKPIASRGVITGCDQEREWLLKWWWAHYTRTNKLPVTFIDFGMSQSANAWCKKRGRVIHSTLPVGLLKGKETFPLPSNWPEDWAKTVRRQRPIWFAKVFSLLQTPYEETLWLDNDCRCNGAVDQVFDICNRESGFSVSLDEPLTIKRWKKMGLLLPHANGYQAGVIAFFHRSQVMSAWAERCFSHGSTEYSEQTALSHTIADANLTIPLLPSCYNWLDSCRDYPKETIVVHYGGEKRKTYLIKEMSFLSA